MSAKPLYETIAGNIRAFIAENGLRRGDNLPPERTLAERFRVSRHSVREAVRVLQQQGVLEAKRGSGIYVLSLDPGQIVDAFAHHALAEKHRLAEIFELRALLEPHVAGLAACMATDANIAEGRRLLEQQATESDPLALRDIDITFHLLIARATGNAVVAQVIQSISHLLHEVRSEEYHSDARREASLISHRRILDALERRSAEDAKHAMAEHIHTIEGLVL